MPNVKLDASFVLTAFCPEGKNKIDYYDTSITGFILEVRSSGGKTYALRYRDEYGRQRQVKIGNAADLTFDRARKEATKIRSRVVVGENPAQERQTTRLIPTVAELADRYLDYVRTYKRSHGNDERVLRLHILPRFGKLRLDELEQEVVANWLKAKVDEGYTPATVNFLHVVLGHMFKLARQWGVAGAAINPMSAIPHFQTNNARERYLTPEETERLRLAVEASPNTQLKYIVPLLLLTGVRKRELLDARWEHFDLEQRRWRVPTSKSGKARHVPLSQAAIDMLARVPRWQGCPYVVPNPETKLPYHAIFYSWDKARVAAGLPDVRMHDLRHSAASNMVNAGQSLYVVGQVLGHVRASTTQRYAHLSHDALLAAVDAGATAAGGTWGEARSQV